MYFHCLNFAEFSRAFYCDTEVSIYEAKKKLVKTLRDTKAIKRSMSVD